MKKLQTVEIDVSKIYPDKITSLEILSSCCYNESKIGDMMYQDPFTKRFHTKDCVERKLGWLNKDCNPDDKHSSGMLIKERIQQLSELIE